MGEGRRAVWRSNAKDKEKDEDRGGSQRDWLQKAKEKLTECHRSIIGAWARVGHITLSVDLTCAHDGRHGRWNAAGRRIKRRIYVGQTCGFEALLRPGRLISPWCRLFYLYCYLWL